MKFICAHCGKEGEKYAGHINRANKLGLKLFCNRTCFGLYHRDGKTIEQKKKEKAEYDKKFRKYYSEEIKTQKAAAFKIDYAANPEKYKKQRQRRYPKHLEYLHTPEYREWKKQYDEQYLSKKQYGELWEAAIVLKRIDAELESHAIKQANGITFNKSSQQRKRKWQQLSKVLLSKI